jgi:EAL domain-containing protein (putative c-di-GMP-specific phosphodiesterase class I)
MLDDEGNLIYPDLFIPAAERFNLISKLDKYIITNAFDFMRTIDASIDCRLSINLSGQSVGNERTLTHINDELSRTGIDPSRICFEVTETAAMTNIASAKKFIRELKNKGCLFALDDFGSGLSSFSYLKNLHVDYLKIDGCFIRNIINDQTDNAMVEAIIKVGNTMGIQTIAEFVESQQIMDKLNSLGVNYVQGHHISSATPITDWKPYSSQHLHM